MALHPKAQGAASRCNDFMFSFSVVPELASHAVVSVV
jgi:hypothetical protein